MIMNKKINELIAIISNSISKIKDSNIDGIIYIKYGNDIDSTLGFFDSKLNKTDNFYKALSILSEDNISAYLLEHNIKILESQDVRGNILNNKIVILDNIENASQNDLRTVMFRIFSESELILIVNSTMDNLELKNMVKDYPNISVIETNENLIINSNRYTFSNFNIGE